MGAREIDFLKVHDVDFLFHMTHIDNLPNIMKYGLRAHGNRFQKQDISNLEVNGRRTRREPVYGRRIHDYVPFYFSPRNPMLYVQQNKEDIVILVFSSRLLLEEGVVFTDGNASSLSTSFYGEICDLDKLNWDCLNNNYWNGYIDGKREKLAEVLLPSNVCSSKIAAVLCKTPVTKMRVDVMTGGHMETYVAKNFFF